MINFTTWCSLVLTAQILLLGCDDESDSEDGSESNYICCAYEMKTSGAGSSGTPSTMCSCIYNSCTEVGSGNNTQCYEGSCITTTYSNIREVPECESVLAADDCTAGLIECLGGEYYKECLSFGEWSDKKTCFNSCPLFSSRYDCVNGECVCN